jgi:pimeloyl-ACP methyl ester carboxylesterase
MSYAEVNDIRMFYEEEGQGEPLLLLHGALGCIDIHLSGWGHLVPTFAECFRTIQVEHRGHGRTDNPAGTLSYEQLADDVADFIAQRDLAPAHVAGVSDGAVIVMALAMTRPELVRSLVLVGANATNDEQVQAANAFIDPDVLAQEHPEFAEMLVRYHDGHHHPGYWRDLVRQNRAHLDVEPNYSAEDLARIQAPTLLIAGETDPFGNVNQMLAMRRAIPNAEMLILNHAGMDELSNHVCQYTRADIVGPAVLDFLARQREPATAGA